MLIQMKVRLNFRNSETGMSQQMVIVMRPS